MLSDGEQSKLSYATYTAGRLESFELQQQTDRADPGRGRAGAD